MAKSTSFERLWLACSIISLLCGVIGLFVVGSAYVKFKRSMYAPTIECQGRLS